MQNNNRKGRKQYRGGRGGRGTFQTCLRPSPRVAFQASTSGGLLDRTIVKIPSDTETFRKAANIETIYVIIFYGNQNAGTRFSCLWLVFIVVILLSFNASEVVPPAVLCWSRCPLNKFVCLRFCVCVSWCFPPAILCWNWWTLWKLVQCLCVFV